MITERLSPYLPLVTKSMLSTSRNQGSLCPEGNPSGVFDYMKLKLFELLK